MRLLLLLSAILTALTGAVGPRASSAQPVAASALADHGDAERLAATLPVSIAVMRWKYRPVPRSAEPAASPAPIVPLYADRLRE